MSESGEKTEQPSPKKVRDARAKGQVAKSTEVVTTASLAAVVAYLWASWGSSMGSFVRMFDEVASMTDGDFRVNAYNAMIVIGKEMIGVMAPILGVTILVAIAANYLQIGSIFALESIAPSLEKVSPAAGFKRIFSMKQLVEILKSIVKITFLSILLYFVVRDAIGPYVASLSCGMLCVGMITKHVLGQIFLYSGLAFLIVAGADFMYQRHAYTKSLMMTKEEVKREFKESEGDPHIKGHRKQLAFELLMGDGGHQAKKGSAVVINPTHLAVVIQYEPEVFPLPIVTAKGREQTAHTIRTSAEQAGVPVFRNVPLARALYATVDINDPVPDELFDAVAEVLVWVDKNRDHLYHGPLAHGVIDMEMGDHKAAHLS